jgi:NAD-dependent SIR2 family protein deacetylase
MTYQDFVSGPVAQQRYWARSFVGWRTMQHARPNAGHVSVAELEAAGVVLATITQNVDGLHQAAGATGGHRPARTVVAGGLPAVRRAQQPPCARRAAR